MRGDLPPQSLSTLTTAKTCSTVGWKATTEEFNPNLERVKEALDELSDDEVMRDEDLARHAFYQTMRTGSHRCTGIRTATRRAFFAISRS
ncbi:Uncharacterized protein SVXHx_3280 (plasmid) [Haloferax volcanii]|nr:Uncharacterized protein SVXHx_3280 [Haloferax lucentense]